MERLSRILKSAVAACLIFFSSAAWADVESEVLDQLFADLKAADAASSEKIEAKIWEEWSKSGSSAMDLLLHRGRVAMSAGDNEAAIAHFSALIDHAPEFAEAYNARATAFYQADLYGPSLQDIRTTLAMNPRHFGALSGLALILEELGELEQALEAYRAIEAIHPNRENLQDAIERLEKAVGGVEL
ncbi:MAG: tetratricopeptide repeat protein [Rhodobacteraceae bacterium]|nr:tetratricopeptide repeat protein [Paracoccaceae bacterium]